MAATMGSQRLAKELQLLVKEPAPLITARPHPKDLFTWHYVIEGPADTPYAGGVYTGVLKFPREYPMKPPRIQMYTPSGRFEMAKDLCLSMSSFHPETWRPAWSVRTVLIGLQSFMLESTPTAGSIETTDDEKRRLAATSLEYNVTKDKAFCELFPEWVDKHKKAKAAAASGGGGGGAGSGGSGGAAPANFVALVSDSTSARSVLAFKHDEDKIRLLDTHKAVAVGGPQADQVQFVEFVQRNVALYEFRTGVKMSTKAAATYIRSSLAEALRKGPYQVNMMLGGYDAATKEEAAAAGAAGEAPAGRASLFWLDYLGTSQEVNYGAHGYCAYFITATMDRFWKAGMSIEDAKTLAKQCIAELDVRFVLKQKGWRMKVVSAEGVKEVEL